MALQPRDVLVALKLHLAIDQLPAYAGLEVDIGLSASTIHRSVGRLIAARLLTQERKVIRRSLFEFLKYGVRYAFYVQIGARTRGVPTAYSAAPLGDTIRGIEDPLIWPTVDGQVRGLAVEPLDPAVPVAASKDPHLYELLALVDAIRVGGTRERKIAGMELESRLLKEPIAH